MKERYKPQFVFMPRVLNYFRKKKVFIFEI